MKRARKKEQERERSSHLWLLWGTFPDGCMARNSAAEIAANLGISTDGVEFLSCIPCAGSMTEVVFMLVESNREINGTEAMFHHQHLGPRQLAAQLAALIARPTSALHKTHTLAKCHALKVFAGHRNTKACNAEDGDSHSTASTFSESDQDQHSDASDGRVVSEEKVLTQEASTSASRSNSQKCLEGRLATFGNWAHARAGGGKEQSARLSKVSPLAMAAQGFYHMLDADSSDMVRCVYCRLEIVPRFLDLPLAIFHRQKSPLCPIVLGTANEPIGLSFRPKSDIETEGAQSAKRKLKATVFATEDTLQDSKENDTKEIQVFQSKIPTSESIKLNTIPISSACEMDSKPQEATSKGPSSRVRQMYASRISQASAKREIDESPGLVLVRKEERQQVTVVPSCGRTRRRVQAAAGTSRERKSLKLVALGSSIALESSGSVFQECNSQPCEAILENSETTTIKRHGRGKGGREGGREGGRSCFTRP